MKLITIDQARDHCKADGDDDAILDVYCDAAEAIAARSTNRDLFATSQERTNALAGINAAMATAYAEYDAAIAAADAADDDRITVMMRAQAQNKLDASVLAAHRVINGMVVTNDLISAILMIVAHLYRNRQAVVSGQNAAAVEVPLSAQYIFEQNRWVGPEYV